MKKTASAKGARVTFELPAEVEATSVHLCGDFNQWSTEATPLTQRKGGRWSTTVSLGPGRYRFRYLLDGATWENDWAADAYEPNAYGSHDSVVEV